MSRRRYRRRYSGRTKAGKVLRLLLLFVLLAVCAWQSGRIEEKKRLESIPASVLIYEQKPVFTEEEMSLYDAAGTAAGERIRLSALDGQGRCGAALMCAGPETMPEEERGEISQIRPSGWQVARYPGLIEDEFLYNRCHLLGFQLCGLNDEERNLITGTRYLNKEEMLPYENEVAGFIRQTGKHVMYRVTPLFKDSELVARSVRIEALSVEDGGSGVCFYVECANAQPGILINYATGSSRPEDNE